MQIEVGQIFEGKVTGITNFGAFVELPEGKSGMVHISEIASTYVNDIKDFVSESQVVKVKVLTISPEGKISLSMKQANPPSPDEGQGQRRPPQGGGRRPQNRPPRKPPQTFDSGFGKKDFSKEPATFEDMMSKFKHSSDERMGDIKRSKEAKNGGGGYSRRGSKKG